MQYVDIQVKIILFTFVRWRKIRVNKERIKTI